MRRDECLSPLLRVGKRSMSFGGSFQEGAKTTEPRRYRFREMEEDSRQGRMHSGVAPLQNFTDPITYTRRPIGEYVETSALLSV